MAIKDFNYKDFANDLAGQASTVVPADLSEDDKKYVIGLIHHFCMLAGEALYNDTSIKLNADQASIITQFIGEWSFHKSIDLIKSGVPPQYRDGVLQKIAFTVFEIAKQAIVNNLPQPQMVQVVEHHVQKTYKAALEELQKRGLLNEEQAKRAESQSNIDDMAKQAKQVDMPASDSKFLKLVAMAIILKQLPKGKAIAILKRFPQEDADMIVQYMDTPDIENKLDKSIVLKYLNEMKSALPAEKVTPKKVNTQLYKIVKNSDFNKISSIIYNERPNIRKFILAPFKKEEFSLPLKVSSVVINYLEKQVNAH